MSLRISARSFRVFSSARLLGFGSRAPFSVETVKEEVVFPERLRVALSGIKQQRNKEKYIAEVVVNSIESRLTRTTLSAITQSLRESNVTRAILPALLPIERLLEMDEAQITEIRDVFQVLPNPKSAIELLSLVDIVTLIYKNEHSAIDMFIKVLNAALTKEIESVTLDAIILQLKKLQEINPLIELNSVIAKKLYEDLYDIDISAWMNVIRVYKLSGTVELEMLSEIDKVFTKDSYDSLLADTELFDHFLNLCASRDFKPSNIEKLENHLKTVCIQQKRLLAVVYLEQIQNVKRPFVQSIFDSIFGNTASSSFSSILAATKGGVKSDLLRRFGVLPPLHEDLVKLIDEKNLKGIVDYVLERTQAEEKPREISLTIEELFLITKFMKSTDMSGRSSASKSLNLPHLITSVEAQLVVEINQTVNRFVKEGIYKRLQTVRQFLQVNCINSFLGFDKQAKLVFDNTSAQFLNAFKKVYLLPVIVEYGKLNKDLLIQIFPVYASYLSNKYIARNQLSLDEALLLMQCLAETKDVYSEQNAMYHNKEFIYATKTIARLAYMTFQERIYANYTDLQCRIKVSENPFLDVQIDAPFKGVKAKGSTVEEAVIINDDLSSEEVEQFLQLFYLANSMNLGSKLLYDSFPVFVKTYFDKLSVDQQATAAYLLSTIDCSDEKLEKKVEEVIEKTKHFSLHQAVGFLSFLTTRYCLSEDLWRKLTIVVENAAPDEILRKLSEEMQLSLALTNECLKVEQPHIVMNIHPDVAEKLQGKFIAQQRREATRNTKFSEAIAYFLERLGFYHDKNQTNSIFVFSFSQPSTQSYLVVLDKNSFIGDTKQQRAQVSVMIRILNRLDLKLKIYNIHDWASKPKRVEKIAYLRLKAKGMAYDAEKQKKKTHFNF